MAGRVGESLQTWSRGLASHCQAFQVVICYSLLNLCSLKRRLLRPTQYASSLDRKACFSFGCPSSSGTSSVSLRSSGSCMFVLFNLDLMILVCCIAGSSSAQSRDFLLQAKAFDRSPSACAPALLSLPSTAYSDSCRSYQIFQMLQYSCSRRQPGPLHLS